MVSTRERRQGMTTLGVKAEKLVEDIWLPPDRKEEILEQGYWHRRKREELALAGSATCAEAKLIHFDLAGRYSVKAGDVGEALPLRPGHQIAPQT